MSDHPISILEGQLRLIRAGQQVTLRRPHGRLARCAVGDRLWIREPFYLEPKFDGTKPTQAVLRGAHVVLWPADFATPVASILVGRRRNAREMPKALHRDHLALLGVRTERLQEIDEIAARAEGFASRAAFRAVWERDNPTTSIGGTPINWASNPKVDVIAFNYVAAPLEARR